MALEIGDGIAEAKAESLHHLESLVAADPLHGFSISAPCELTRTFRHVGRELAAKAIERQSTATRSIFRLFCRVNRKYLAEQWQDGQINFRPRKSPNEELPSFV